MNVWAADKFAFIDKYSLSIAVLDGKPNKPKNHTSISITPYLLQNTIIHQIINSDQLTGLQAPTLVTQLINHYLLLLFVYYYLICCFN